MSHVTLLDYYISLLFYGFSLSTHSDIVKSGFLCLKGGGPFFSTCGDGGLLCSAGKHIFFVEKAGIGPDTFFFFMHR